MHFAILTIIEHGLDGYYTIDQIEEDQDTSRGYALMTNCRGCLFLENAA